MDRQPNVIELGRKPNPCRYVWVAQSPDDSLRQGATWVSLKRAIEELGEVIVTVLDLYTQKGQVVDPEEFLENWRANYFDDTWSFMK